MSFANVHIRSLMIVKFKCLIILKLIFFHSKKFFDDWLRKTPGLKLNENDEPQNFTFLTCGDWDLIKMLPKQCKHFNLSYPNYFRQWINIKKSYCELTGTFPKGMITMLDQLSNGFRFILGSHELINKI